jgi:hypothetical protein
MKNLLSVNYYFSTLPGLPNLLFWNCVMAGAALVIAFGIVSLFMARRWRNDGIRRRVWRRFMVWSFTIGPVCYIWAFFRYQNALFLSMRFWIFAWLALALAWLLWILKIRLVNVPRRIRAREEKDEYTKYLPQRK